MGEGEGGGARRRRLNIKRLPPSRPSPARGEGEHAPWAGCVPNGIEEDRAGECQQQVAQGRCQLAYSKRPITG
jgi:hypothetical protein